jgi:hypothetical protein
VAPKHKPIVHWRQLVSGPVIEQAGPGPHRMMLEAAVCAHLDGCASCVQASVERISADTAAMITMRRFVTVLATGEGVPFGEADEAAHIESGSVADRESVVASVIVVIADMFTRMHAHHRSEPAPQPPPERVRRPGQRKRGHRGHVH